MPQKFGLYEDLTVYENLKLYSDLQNIENSNSRIDELLTFTSLKKFQDRLAGKLSGGMKQKLGLACALIKKPKLLLLDEPGVGVDPISRIELWEIVQKLLEDDKKRLETREIVEIEKKFSVNFNEFELIGVIDRVDKFEDSYELIDYKTSRSLKIDTINTYSKSCDFQLEFYFLAIKNLYKTTNIKAFYYDIFENSLKQEVVLNEKLELLQNIFDDLKNQSKSKISTVVASNVKLS